MSELKKKAYALNDKDLEKVSGGNGPVGTKVSALCSKCNEKVEAIISPDGFKCLKCGGGSPVKIYGEL